MTQRFRQITEIAAKLFVKFDHAFFLPITQGHLVAKIGNIPTTFDKWLQQDLAMLSACNELWVVKMDGWQESTGVQAEIKFANENLIKLKYLDPKQI